MRPLRCVTLPPLLLALAGCCVTAGPGPRGAARPASPARPPLRVDPCAGAGAAILTSAADVALACRDAHRQCSGKLGISVRNCTPARVIIEQLLLARDGRLHATHTLDPRAAALEPGAAWRFDRETHAEGAHEARVVVRSASDRAPRAAPPARFRVTNPARDRARAACRACNGNWGQHGLLGLESCNCRTRDAGKVCHDGDECEGDCLHTGFDVVVAPQPLRCGPDGRCSARVGQGVPVGRCSELRVVFGCRARIGRGASREPPVLLPGHLQSICVD